MWRMGRSSRPEIKLADSKTARSLPVALESDTIIKSFARVEAERKNVELEAKILNEILEITSR
jgi:hypothetical protein